MKQLPAALFELLLLLGGLEGNTLVVFLPQVRDFVDSKSPRAILILLPLLLCTQRDGLLLLLPPFKAILDPGLAARCLA